MIYKKTEYVQNDTGDPEFPIKQVDVLEAADGSGQRFVGRAAVNIQGPIAIQQVPVSFEIPADSVQSAFEKYTEYAKPKLEEAKARLERRLDEVRKALQARGTSSENADAPRGGVIRFDDFHRDR